MNYQSFIGVCANVLVIMCNSSCCPSIAIGPIAIIANTSFSSNIMTIIATIIKMMVHSIPNTISTLSA